MFSKLLQRLAILGLAFIASCLGLAEVTKAYFFIDIGWSVLVIIVLVAIIAIGGAVADENAAAGIINTFVIFLTAVLIAINLAISGIISWIFKTDFYTTYIIIDFIFCLIPNKKKEW